MKILYSKSAKEWVHSIIYALIIIIALNMFFWTFIITGISMEDGLCSGNVVMVSKFLGITNKLGVGDLVIINMPQENSKHIVKRIVATGGDRVTITGGELYINGKKMNEPYTKGSTYSELDIFVPENEFFCLGDNREHSIDSRDIGTIASEKIVGKVIVKIFP